MHNEINSSGEIVIEILDVVDGIATYREVDGGRTGSFAIDGYPFAVEKGAWISGSFTQTEEDPYINSKLSTIF